MDSLGGKTTGTPILEIVSTKLQRIAQLAREEPKRVTLSFADSWISGYATER